MCIYKPMFGLSPECFCLICLLNVLHHPILSLLPPPAKRTCILVAANGALYSCKLARGGNRGGGMEEENSSGSHCCLHGEAADLAVPPLPYAQNPFPPQLVFDMLKYRERDRENRAFERDSLQTWHQAYLG